MPDSAPADFSVRYHYDVGSLPPPYHYAYTVRIGPGAQGEVEYEQSYEGEEGYDTWTEPFSISGEEVEALYDLMVEQGVFARSWQQTDDPPVGGDAEWLDVTAGGKEFSVPSYVAGRGAENAIGEVYEAINALVPASIREKIGL